MQQKYIFIMFSSTPSKMGRFIRTVTKNHYNHVSLCLDMDGVTLYSFARKYRRHPFYGGFVRESSSRFIHNNHFADIKLCAIPVTEEQHEAVKEYLRAMEGMADHFIYNHFSAISTVVNKRIRIENAYTCVEFSAEILADVGVLTTEQEQQVCLVSDLEYLLHPYAIYEGSFRRIAYSVCNVGDKFEKNKNVYKGTWQAFYTNSKLLYSLLRSM